MNLLHAIGVLLIMCGFSVFVIGVIRYFFPSLECYVPTELKKVFTIGVGVFITFAGMLLLKL